MYIKRLVLVNYKRLMLSDVKRFEYIPTKSLQLIIGSNGSGKSSILNELTPLPAHHSEFTKDGEKEFECTHNGVDYHLKSVYSSGSGKHSFIKNGVELNKGGTFSIQMDLVKHEFGLTRAIHEILTDQTPFSSLSTAKRRELLTEMSPVDLTFAFEFYNKVKMLHRDQQGVIKHMTKRMAREHQEVPDLNERELHVREIDRITNQLNRLFELRDSNVVRPFSNTSELEAAIKRITMKGRDLLNTYPTMPDIVGIKSLTDFKSEIDKVENQYAIEVQLLERLSHEYDELSKQLPNRDDVLSEEAIAALKQQLKEIDTILGNATLSQSKVFPIVDLPMDRNPEELLQNTFNEWVNLVKVFPDNEDGRFSAVKGNEAKERYTALKNERINLETRQATAATRLARLKGCESIRCPECTHTFKPGIDPRDIGNLDRQLTDIYQRIQIVESEMAQLSEYLEAVTDYSGYMRQFKRLVESSDSSFKPIWDVCLERRVMSSKPSNYISHITQWFNAMKAHIERSRLFETQSIIRHKLRYVEAIDKTSINSIDEKRKVLEESISLKTDQINQIQRRVELLKRTYRQLDAFFKRTEDAVVEFEQLRDKVRMQMQAELQACIEADAKALQLQAAQHQSELSKWEVRDSLLKDIERQNQEARALYDDYGLALKALSPTDGLIGRYLMTFLQSAVKLVNAVIAEVWTYPLEVLPSKVERDDLDYKFPLSIRDGSVNAPDIDKGSSSQCDMVNFAFKLIIMKFLNLEGYPLYLDEFGKTFDEQHRLNSIPFINKLIELGQVRQLFYISHFDATHGAFNQAEICVLDPTNITVPSSYNHHVKMS